MPPIWSRCHDWAQRKRGKERKVCVCVCVRLKGKGAKREKCVKLHVCDMAFQSHAGKRGQGGVACIYKSHLDGLIDVCKIDQHKRYI